ncbi:hypothetical protein BJX66DRAFT_345787 [Aspergillus keveii]|uniref:C2H2-type domain-containing protein n=1 Tax=Aspergillus keveii TaxID=714993 RepID=A0ABR4FHA4_9EURO
MENQLFEKIPSLQIIICRQCKHGVRPAEVERHLKQKHQFKHQQASQVGQAVRQWADTQQDSQAIQIPRVLEHPLPIVPCHMDGFLCQQDDGAACHYIGSTMASIRLHWHQVHQWSQQGRRGRVGQREKARGEAELARSYRRVAWQQVFPTRKGSHYIHIRCPEGRQGPPPPPPAEQAQLAVDAMADEATDANPCLHMTRWARYLEGVHPQDLQQLVEAPAAVGDASEAEDHVEQAVQTIWDAMDQLARTEAGQTPYQPLLVY